MTKRIFIPFNCPSSKNSKVKTSRGVFNSKTVRKYLQKLGVKKYHKNEHENYKKRPNLFEEAVAEMKADLASEENPHVISFHFIRDSHRKFDLVNACQLICDLLVAHGVIEDDNMDCLIPAPLMIDGKWYGYDKENPGVIIDYGE